MPEYVKTIIDSAISETVEFILLIPSLSIDHWKVVLPLFGALFILVFSKLNRKKRRL